MKVRKIGWYLSLTFLGCTMETFAAEGQVYLSVREGETFIKVDGDKDDDWRVDFSSDLKAWNSVTPFQTILSGNAVNAPWKSLGEIQDLPQFYRARRTEGLFDPSLFRTISLTFTQANWGTLLANARLADTNIVCSLLTLDNGATNWNVGARYKGNSSYSMAGTKKSINLEIDFLDPDADLMNHQTLNLNNAAGDQTMMREALFFTVMNQYTPCPKASMANVVINGTQWGVYSLVQQENGYLLNEWFPNNDGDRWRAPNAAGVGPLVQRPGPGGMFASSNSAFSYFGNTNLSTYVGKYELKTSGSDTNTAWNRLIHAIYILNTTPKEDLRSVLEDVLAVDDWLWLLALENLFVDDDSYWNKGADYGFYYEPLSGRIHPVEHDGNEAFTSATGINYNLSPVIGETGNNRPLLFLLLPINELRQRYLAHMRTVLEERFNPDYLTGFIDELARLSVEAITSDPNKGFSMAAHASAITSLKTYVTNRYNYLITHSELTPKPPSIQWVQGPEEVSPDEAPRIQASVLANDENGIDSVWLYYRDKSYGKFEVQPMFDDGMHGDGIQGDGIFGGETEPFPAGHKIHYYIEARAGNAAKAATFYPARAEWVTLDYRVGLRDGGGIGVILNEFLADNVAGERDPQGELEDWIELYNMTDEPLALEGLYLTDDATRPTKWPFPEGTIISGKGYLIIWADEDGQAEEGLHANFKLSKTGEAIYLIGPDGEGNPILDSIVFGEQRPDITYGRTHSNPEVWDYQSHPTPGSENVDP